MVVKAKIITVSSDGKMTARNLGKSTITATHRNLKDSIEIKVNPIEAENIEIILPVDVETNENGQLRMEKDIKLQFKATVKPENTTFKDIEWRTGDSKIAQIDENGIITAKRTGLVTVYATAESGVTDEIEIEIYSDITYIVIGISLVGIIGATTTAIAIRRKKTNK